MILAQDLESPIGAIVNIKNDGVKLKKIYSENDKIDEYKFETGIKLTTKATVKNIFVQLENKKSKKTTDQNLVDFFDELKLILNDFNFKEVYNNEEDRIMTFRNNSQENVSLLEIYYEDHQLSLIEITHQDQFDENEFFDVDTIHSVESQQVNFSSYALDEIEMVSMIKSYKKKNSPITDAIIIANDSLLARYDIDFKKYKYEFSETSLSQIDSISFLLRSNPNNRYIIASNTSIAGARYANYTLSKKRAKLICEILINFFDVNKEQLFYKGNGEQYQINDNNTAKKIEMNKRTDLLSYYNYEPNRIRK